MLRLIMGWFVQVEGKCRAGQMLAALGLDISLAGLQAATATAAKDLLLLLLRQLADTQPPLLESRYCFCHPASVTALKNTEALKIIMPTMQCSVWQY